MAFTSAPIGAGTSGFEARNLIGGNMQDRQSLPLIRTSERASFKRCPQQWYWAWRMGYRKRGMQPDALWFGTGVHHALAEYYIPGTKRGVHPAEAWQQWSDGEIRYIKTLVADRDRGVFAGYGEEMVSEYVDAVELGTTMLEGYVNRWQGDLSWDVIAREQTFGLVIPKLGTKREPLLRMHGTFDGVYRDQADGHVKLMEHKTAARINTSHLTIDDQAGGYAMAATAVLRQQGLIEDTEYVRYVTYNFLRKARPDDRPRNERGEYLNAPLKSQYVDEIMASDVAIRLNLKRRYLEGLRNEQLAAAAVKYDIPVVGEVSKNQGEPLFERFAIERTVRERRGQLTRLQAEGMAMERFRTGEQPLYKTPRYDCQRFCQFFNLCEVHESGGDWQEFAESLLDTVDPYADHRKSAGE